MTVSRDVRLNVIAETKRYQQELAKVPGFTEKQAARAAARWEKEFTRSAIEQAKAQERAAKASADAWEDFGNLVASQLTADALKAGAQAVFEYTEAVMEARAEQINLAESTGIALDTLAGIEVAAERAGVPVTEITGAFEDFGEVLFDAANGGGRAEEALELLKFTNEDLQAGLKNTDQALRTAIERMVAIEDQGKRNAVAQQLFGDAGNRLNAVLGDGTLEDYIAAAEELGLVLDEEAVENTKRWTAATAELDQVLRGTANELVDFFEVGRRIQDFTLGFVFLKELLTSFANEGLRSVSEQLQGMALILTGNFAEGLEVLEGATGLDALSDALKVATTDATNASFALFETRREIDQTGDAARDTSRALADLSGNQDRASRDAEKAARAEAKAAREREKAANEWLKALDQVENILGRATEDQLTGFERIALAQQEQIDQIRELEQVLGNTAITRLALQEVNERAAREEAALLMELDEQAKLAAIGFDELDQQLKDLQRQRLMQNIQIAQQGFDNLASAANDLLGLQLANEAEAGRATAARLDEELRRREELAEAIENAGSAEEAAALERDAAAVDRAIARDEKILAQQREQATRLFKAQKALQIASIIGSGAVAAAAAFAPPPVGAGPIGGPFLAGTIAAATAAQVAVVSSQQPPQFHAGFAGFTNGSDETLAMLRQQETVNNQRLTDALGGPEAVREGNQTGSLPGRQTVVSLEVGGRQIGMAVVDEMDAGRELTQSMNRRMGRRVGVRPVYQTR